ncbi:MAG: hypothetical protein V1900_03220 [Candidatus Aenigmatarchaeota archaeon]
MDRVFVLIVLILLSSVAIAGFSTFGRSVTMNLAFHIADNKSDDIILINDSYVLAEDNGTVLALLSSGTVFGTRNTSYNASENLFEAKQSLDNRFLLVFTSGNNQTILSKLNLIGEKKIPAKTLGNLSYYSPSSFPLYLRLDYSDVDIISKLHWPSGAREIIIKNEGKNAQGLPKIGITVSK